MEKLSTRKVKKIAAALKLDLKDELDIYTEELNIMIDRMNLQKLENTQFTDMCYPMDLSIVNMFREDIPVPSLNLDDVFKNTIHRHGNYFAIPTIN